MPMPMPLARLAAVGPLLLWLAPIGCNSWHAQSVRPPTPDEALAAGGDVDEADPSPQLVKGFFKPTRTLGGWSSEANEIESHLGVR